MSNLYAWINDTACKFPITDKIVELDPITMNDYPVISSLNRNGTATITLNLNASGDHNNSNRQYLDEFLKAVTDASVEAPTLMSNKYKMFIDAVVYDEKRNVIEEGVKIHNIDAQDVIRIQGIDADNNGQYVMAKSFNALVQFSYPAVSTGVVGVRKAPRYVRIRNVVIMGEVATSDGNSNGVAKLNKTLIDTSLSPMSATVEDIKARMIPICDSRGVSFGVVDLVNSPRAIDINVNITLEGFILPYDEAIITDTFKEIYKKNHPDEDPKKPDPDKPNPNPDQPVPGTDNFFQEFVRANGDEPTAKKVTLLGGENGYPIDAVKKDIPDIQVGDWVMFEESIVISGL